jgi:hypothetical protein
MAKTQARLVEQTKFLSSVREAIRQMEDEMANKAGGARSKRPEILSEERLLRSAKKYYKKTRKICSRNIGANILRFGITK